MVQKIDKVLQKSEIKLKQLDAFVIGRGPGAFTSLRVGMATIKAMAYAIQKPVLGVSSLDAIAMNIKGDCENICVAADARRQMVYAATYNKKDAKLTRTSDYMLLPVKDLLKTIPKNCTFVGDGAALYKNEIVQRKHMINANEKLYTPNAKQFLTLTQERIKNKEFDDLDALEPLYLYPEDCQVQK